MILPFTLILTASICNAVMDITSHKFYQSVFNSPKFNPLFWNPAISWKNKYINGDINQGRKQWNIFGLKINIHPAFTDSWHLFKSTMIFCLVGAIVLYDSKGWVWDLILFVIYGTAWNLTFSLFYNKLLKKRLDS